MSLKPWNEKRLFATPQIWPADDELCAAESKKRQRLYPTEGEKTYKTLPRHIKPIWVEGDKYEGRATRHFAWYGLPTELSRSKVPAMVLVHGGGGTAFLKWVEIWNRRGYAAIAVDTCGNLPVARKYGEWASHDFSHNSKWGDFENTAKPASDQWCYHAITAIIRAHSFLRNLPEIDNTKIGITGISWGGYLVSIASSIDSRFRFAAPVYGCGFIEHDDSPWKPEFDKLSARLTKRWMKLWDPSTYLPMSKVPTLWTTGSNDFAYNLEMLTMSRNICAAEAMLSIHIRYGHSHQHGWKLSEPYAFADSFCKGGPKLKSPAVNEKQGRIITTGKNILRATLCYTKDNGKLPELYWKQIKMTPDGTNRFSAKLPTDAAAWFVNIVDANRNILSSDVSFNLPSATPK